MGVVLLTAIMEAATLLLKRKIGTQNLVAMQSSKQFATWVKSASFVDLAQLAGEETE